MKKKKFAYETDELAIVFYSTFGLGDAVIARKAFEAIIELAPNCVADFFCLTDAHRKYAESFYSDIKNLNRFLNPEEYAANIKKYDLALCIGGCHVILFEYANPQRLQAMAPKLFEATNKIEMYNRQHVYGLGPWKLTVAFRNMISAEIIGKNCFFFMSCGGALPIRDDNLYIPLNPDFKKQFDALKLKKYITIYTDIDEKEKDLPKVKTWPLRYYNEYIARMKKRFPNIEIVQVGGPGDVKVESADRHYLGVDLELTKHILSNSLLLVGCEGGLVHLATFLGTKCLVLFGSSDATYFGYNQNINLISEICQPCMYIVPSFQICMRGNKEPPCMLSHTPQNVCEVTCNYLNRLDLENKA